MNKRVGARLAPAVGVLLFFFFTFVLGFGASIDAQRGRSEKDAQKAQQQEAQALVKLVEAAKAGQSAPSEIPVAWRGNHFLKAQEGRTYVPFTVSIGPAQGTKELAMYVRVSQRGEVTAEEEIAFESLHFVYVSPGKAGQLSRAFSVPGGDYDVWVAVKDRASTARNAPPPKTTVYHHDLTVPDFWDEQFTTSSIIVADSVEATTPLPPAEQMEHPYTLGPLKIVPAADDQFSKKDALQLIFHIYNPALDANNKPDVTIEYNFYNLTPERTFFNKTEPQVMNASTLPPQFDVAAGHQLPGGMEVPLESFPEGPYELEITIKDNIADKTITREVNFTVVGP
jgi:hypothetical protein